MHRPFLNYILAGHYAVLRSDSKQRMRTKFPRSLSAVRKKKKTYLWLNERVHYFLPFTLMLLVVSSCLILTVDGSNNCLNLNEEKHWTLHFIFIERKQREEHVIEISLTNNSTKFYFGGSQCWTKASVTLQTPALMDYSHIIRPDTWISSF